MATMILSFAPAGKLISTKTHVKFFSTTVAEDIISNNYKTVSTLDTQSGDVVFSVPMQNFEFEIAQMQKHFNGKDFLDTKTHPKAKFVGKITNISAVNFSQDGTYNALVSGDMTIKGVTKSINEKGTVTVKGNIVSVNSKFNLTLAEYGIAFEKGKPSTNIAETVLLTVLAEYKAQ
jgi:polyisoprenoid-binding protein YceI